MTTAIVTGGLGFIGHHLVEYLLARTDFNIVVLDTGDLPHSEERANDSERVEYIYCDLADERWMKKITVCRRVNDMVKSPDFIFNLASNSHVDTSIEHPSEFVKNNLLLQVNVLEYARQFGCEKFVQVSTDEVFGPSVDGWVGFKEGSPHNPSNPYSASKSCQEQLCNAWWKTYGLPIVIVNSMNNYGIRQECEKFIPKAIGKIFYQTPVPIHAVDVSPWRGPNSWISGSRKWINVLDFCEALLLVANKTQSCYYLDFDNRGNFVTEVQRFNVGGEQYTNEEIVDKISSVLGIVAKKQFVDGNKDRPGHDVHYALDDQKICDQLGWRPKHTLDDSLKNIVTWYLENKGVWLCP